MVKKMKKRVCCDFCGKSSGNRYETRQHKHVEDESLESKVKRLRLVTRRLTGVDLYGLSYHETECLMTHLDDALRTEKMKKPETYKRNERNSREEMREQFERQQAETSMESSLECEYERLWLLKERMSGRELGNMTYIELCLLKMQITSASLKMAPTHDNSDVFPLLLSV